MFEAVVDGGFGNHLKLEEGALLELGRFENPHVQPLLQEQIIPESATSDDVTSPDPITLRNNGRRRFTHFHFRKRSQSRRISGPALAVVDAEPAVAQEGKTKGGKDVEEGVKVTIRLAALDEQGTELASPNEQITYLHIVRLGHTGTEAPKEGGEQVDEDVRPWVVKVVKREATVSFNILYVHCHLQRLLDVDWTTHIPPPRDLRLDVLIYQQQQSSPHHHSSICHSHIPAGRTTGSSSPQRRRQRRPSVRVSPMPVFSSRGCAPSMPSSCSMQRLCFEHDRVRSWR